MTENNRLIALDGLCAILGMVILVYHVNTVFGSPLPQALAPIYEYGGYLGNYMFFIISGLRMALGYKSRFVAGECSFGQFFLRRICRLYPIYFLSNLAMILLGCVEVSAADTATTFLMMSTGWLFGTDMPYNFPAWFICVLMICYILYFIVGKISAKLSVIYPYVCGLLVIGGALLEVLDLDIPFLYRVCGEGYMNFFLGVLLAEIYTAALAKKADLLAAENSKALKMEPIIQYLICCAVVCLFIMFVLLPEFLPGDMRWWVSLICAGFVVMALFGGVFAGILSVLLLRAVGRCCLSLMLWHIPLVRLWEGNAFLSRLDSGFGFLLYLLMIIAISLLSYYCIEQPFVKLYRSNAKML